MPRPARKVALVAMPRVIALDYSIAANVLGAQPGYELIVAGDPEHPGPEDGVVIVPTHPLTALDESDVVVVPGYGDPRTAPPDTFLEAIASANARGASMVGICTGTFALAASGITAGREVTTHWRYTRLLDELFPTTRVIDNVLYVQDENLLTSAGAGAGIDACLHLIRTDLGVDAEVAASREWVAGPARPGSQPQYMDVFSPPRADLSRTRSWALQRLDQAITVDQLARHSAMSRRTFIRRFREQTGMPPMNWLTQQRVLVARRMLETSDWSIDRIASASGLGTAANFRVVFRRETGSLPSDYRRAHRATI